MERLFLWGRLCGESVVLTNLRLNLRVHVRLHLAAPPASAAVQHHRVQQRYSHNHQHHFERREVIRPQLDRLLDAHLRNQFQSFVTRQGSFVEARANGVED